MKNDNRYESHTTLKALRKPYHLLLVAVALFFIAGFFSGEPSFDYHIRDTYYVSTSLYFNWIPVILLLFMWAVYSITYRALYSHKLVWIHVITTLTTLFLLSLVSFIFYRYQDLAGMPRRYYDYDTWRSARLFSYLDYPTKIKVILLLVMITAQGFYFVNLVAGLMKKVRISKGQACNPDNV